MAKIKHIVDTLDDILASGTNNQSTSTENSVQACLVQLQDQQESAVNNGHRPDRAVCYILQLEAERVSVCNAERRLHRALREATIRATEAGDRLHFGI